MNTQDGLRIFSDDHLGVVNTAVALSEELVSNAYKMSASQWLRRRYDVKTLVDLAPGEVADGPLAQLIRYKGQRKESPLGSAAYDFYKICLQDHTILSTLGRQRRLELLPFALYIVVHELVHIVRFSMFLQSFHASETERLIEENRVHHKTRSLLAGVKVEGIAPVLRFFESWKAAVDGMRNG